MLQVGIIPYKEIDPAAPAEDAFGPRYANVPWALMMVNWGAVIGLFTTLITGLYSQANKGKLRKININNIYIMKLSAFV